LSILPPILLNRTESWNLKTERFIAIKENELNKAIEGKKIELKNIQSKGPGAVSKFLNIFGSKSEKEKKLEIEEKNQKIRKVEEEINKITEEKNNLSQKGVYFDVSDPDYVIFAIELQLSTIFFRLFDTKIVVFSRFSQFPTKFFPSSRFLLLAFIFRIFYAKRHKCIRVNSLYNRFWVNRVDIR
jgi:hypothetical protein